MEFEEQMKYEDRIRKLEKMNKDLTESVKDLIGLLRECLNSGGSWKWTFPTVNYIANMEDKEGNKDGYNNRNTGQEM